METVSLPLLGALRALRGGLYVWHGLDGLILDQKARYREDSLWLKSSLVVPEFYYQVFSCKEAPPSCCTVGEDTRSQEERNDIWNWDKSGRKGFVVTGLWMTLIELQPCKRLSVQLLFKIDSIGHFGVREFGPLSTLERGSGLLLIILVKSENQYTQRSPLVTVSPPLLEIWLVCPPKIL